MYTDEEMKIYSITKCDMCRDKFDKKEKPQKNICKLCYEIGEMMKKYKNNKQKSWVHTNCVKWFMSNVKIEVESSFIVFNEIKPKLNDVIIEDCMKCGKSNGLKVKCSVKSCDFLLHQGCIETSLINEEAHCDRTKFKFLSFRCEKCTASRAQNKKVDKFLETKTYGKDVNNTGETTANIK
jgi:hypothetical protein